MYSLHATSESDSCIRHRRRQDGSFPQSNQTSLPRPVQTSRVLCVLSRTTTFIHHVRWEPRFPTTTIPEGHLRTRKIDTTRWSTCLSFISPCHFQLIPVYTSTTHNNKAVSQLREHASQGESRDGYNRSHGMQAAESVNAASVYLNLP